MHSSNRKLRLNKAAKELVNRKAVTYNTTRGYGGIN